MGVARVPSIQLSLAPAMIVMPPRRQVAFVPLAGATASPGYPQVGGDKCLVKSAPIDRQRR